MQSKADYISNGRFSKLIWNNFFNPSRKYQALGKWNCLIVWQCILFPAGKHIDRTNGNNVKRGK